ncbi:protein WVD2-like 7 isoform X2 [Magnolia sinica]|uniref:protein WVD2-like 7 isoform X2 n=1 Tax=Magnolia sinica TaxID=86752 RepID=UPI00265AEE74|nr:protein WVD2-like 7 isoform X2 [Magnolia sinica]
MAGEIEDPIGFQGDCLPTGSISFGRFEEESLSWERRSSFSHNRYLEEVKKYSRPGSVIEKKAYFEAHFKRKALLHQAASSECQNGMGCQSAENDILDDINYMEDFEGNDNEATLYAQCRDGTEYQTAENDILEHMNYVEDFEDNGNEETHYTHYDETPDGSDEHECEVMDCEREGELISPNEFQMGPKISNADTVLDDDTQEVEPGEIFKTQFGCGTSLLFNNDLKIEPEWKLESEAEFSKTEVEQKRTDEVDNSKLEIEHSVSNQVENADGLLKKTDQLVKNSTTEMDKAPSSKKPQKLPLNDSENAKAKLNQENKRDKDLKAKRVSMVPQAAAEKAELEGRRSASRPKHITTSAKSDLKSSGVIFNFKSSERAEKRRQFYLKLEEKQHAKEAEMNQIQARTQEEMEAKMKQFRRSLNFKATPMPSFYHEAAPQSSNGKKAVIAHTKSPKSRSKSMSPGSTASAPDNSQPFSKNVKQQGPHSASDSVNTAQPQTQEATNCHGASEANVNRQTPMDGSDDINEMGTRSWVSQAGKKTEVGKNEREKCKASSGIQGQYGDAANKVRKGERMKATRAGVSRKTKDVGSEMGRLAVHVAS